MVSARGCACAPQIFLLECLQLLFESPGPSRQMFECLTHCMRAGLGALLSERSQSTMAKFLSEAATAKAAAEPAVLVCLKEACTLLLTLREVATGARDALLHGERSLMILVEHPARQVRLAACACLWALTVAFPSQLTGLLNASLNRVRTEHAKLAKGGAETGERLVAHATAAGALVCAIPHTAHGAPYALTTQTIALAAELASTAGVEPAQHSAWLLLRALLRLDLEWLHSKQRLSQLLGLWKGVLGKPVELTGKRGEAEMLTTALQCRSHALGALNSFLVRAPENISAPMMKHIVTALLPPNTALLATCAPREQQAALGKASEGFRPAFTRFRAKLYELFERLPSNAMRADVLNVMMPLVIADIVDPTSTLAPSCTALPPLLDPADACLGSSAEDERPPEPLREGVAARCREACDEFGVLGSEGADEENVALAASISLFAAVFRLQTSDMRQYLLEQLNTAAVKASKDAAKAAAAAAGGGGLFGGPAVVEKSPYASPLANVSAALLGSLTKLKHRPSKMPLGTLLASAGLCWPLLASAGLCWPLPLNTASDICLCWPLMASDGL